MRLLTAKQVAGILQVTTARVYELARQNVLPTARLGDRQVRFDQDALYEWVRNGGTSQQETGK
jgi:excisionase family DNA binding protein